MGLSLHDTEAKFVNGHDYGRCAQAAWAILGEELDDWSRLAVDGHFNGRWPWHKYEDLSTGALSRLVGA